MSIACVEEARVVQRFTPMAGGVELVLAHPEAAAQVEAGQFFQLAVGARQTLLRRPYSVAWADRDSGRIGFIFSVVGAGSAWLAARNEGQAIDVLGPLGRGFDLDGDRPAVCVAGGLGVAMFPGVVQALIARGRQVTVLHGARTTARLLPAERFQGAEVHTATDDGSVGHRGFVVDLLRRMAWVGGSDLFACGPTPMLQALVDEARRLELPLSSVQVALETPMGCGTGTCLGCAAPRRDGGYLITCQEGPCLRADRIAWDRIAEAFHA